VLHYVHSDVHFLFEISASYVGFLPEFRSWDEY